VTAGTAAGTGGTVEVWLIQTDLPDPVIAGLEMLLDDDERARACALLDPVHRRRFIASHGAVRVILGHRLGAPPVSLRWRYGPHGKPELAGTAVRVSLSHSGGLAALALADLRRVGVDVQEMRAGLAAARMAARFYPPAEARFVMAGGGPAGQADRFTRLWARKEACLKVTGGRLMPGLQQVVLADGVAGGCPDGMPLIRDLRVPPGFRGAVAAEGATPYRITRRWWPDSEAPPTLVAIPRNQLASLTEDMLKPSTRTGGIAARVK
jgi:4'-phosphopantetheinyl transferase